MRPTTDAIWRERVREWKRSGLSAAEFTAHRGFSAWSLYAWNRRLCGGSRRKRATSHAIVPSRPPTFVEVVNAAAVVGNDSWPGREAASEPFEVVLVDGVRVRVPVRFDDAAVARLVSALEGR